MSNKIDYKAIYQYIEDSIDNDDYTLEGRKNKLEHLSDRLHSEYDHMVKRVGVQSALAEWLQGLAIDIAFYNGEIIDLAKKWGSLPENPTENQEYKVLDNYWQFMAWQIIKMCRKEKVSI